jgi:hypothetical protein
MIPGILLAATASAASAQPGKLRVEIQTPTADLLLPSSQTSIEVEGGASIFGGVKYLDLFLVLDSSKSLRRTDPKDYRTAGAVGLVQSLPKKSDIQIGVVDFDWDAELLAPLTADRTVAVEALRRLDQNGSTDLADGIRTALEGFELRARADSSRVILLFADGKSDADEAREAMEEARRRGVAIHTLLLGSDDGGEDLLREIAEETGGSFVPVSDPATLPQAFLDLRTTGVEKVTLHVNGSPPRPALLTGGTFRATVPLRMGENQIVATATSLGGETREHAVTVIVSGDLAVAIDAPLNGTLFVERETETPVNGSATAFANAAPEILARHADRGIRSVVLRVNDSPPFATTLADGRFHGRVLLREGENRIVAMASSEDGRSASDAVSRDRLRRIEQHVGADRRKGQGRGGQGNPSRGARLAAPRPLAGTARLRPPAQARAPRLRGLGAARTVRPRESRAHRRGDRELPAQGADAARLFTPGDCGRLRRIPRRTRRRARDRWHRELRRRPGRGGARTPGR